MDNVKNLIENSELECKLGLRYEDLPDYLNMRELQQYLRCGQNKAYNLANRRDFPHFRDGVKKIFPKKLVKEWIEREIEVQMCPKLLNSFQRGGKKSTK